MSVAWEIERATSRQDRLYNWPAHSSRKRTAFIHQHLKESQVFVLPDGLY